MQTLGYADFSLRLHRRVVAGRVPANGTIEVTRRCPLTCAHCYNNLPMGDAQAGSAELTFAEHCRILDEITDAGCLWLLYTGGEIFARPDFLDIYTCAKQKGLIITLFTNGTLITPRIADYLVEWRPFTIEITLYGRTRETYEQFTGISGSYERCMRGIRLLTERGLPLKLKTVGVTFNRHEVGEMKRFAEEDLGVAFKFDAMINPRIDCSQSPLAVRLPPEEIVALDLEHPDRVREWQDLAARTVRPSVLAQHSENVYGCGGGMNAFAIDPYGKMSLCVLSEAEKYDLRQGSFQEGWESFLRAVREQRRTRWTKCVACQLKGLCGMCPATGELENGDKESPVDFLCHVAHLRAHALGITVPPHGDCEYCEGGAAYPDLLLSAANLKNRPAPTLSAFQGTISLPMVSERQTAHSGGCASGGCSFCPSNVRPEGLTLSG
ncbi:MAG: radical SAM protein [Armatimonadetes bacterium]|nr:radical SAM protein [Armatimonadota bacterium]